MRGFQERGGKFYSVPLGGSVKSGLDQSTFIGVVGVWARLEGLRKELEVKSQQQQVQTTLLSSFVFKRVVEIN